jgi:hypothetical protein
MFLALTILFGGLWRECTADDVTGVSSTSVLRQQLQSIADEVISQAQLDEKSRVALWVEGDGTRSLAENAFIEGLQKKNYTSVLSQGITTDQTLHVFLLAMDIDTQELAGKLFERTISTSLEVRIVKGSEHETHVLGTFQRETKDTAQVFSSLQLPVPVKEESTFQKIFAPIIFVSGAILIVYLLFTVRS